MMEGILLSINHKAVCFQPLGFVIDGAVFVVSMRYAAVLTNLGGAGMQTDWRASEQRGQ